MWDFAVYSRCDKRRQTDSHSEVFTVPKYCHYSPCDSPPHSHLDCLYNSSKHTVMAPKKSAYFDGNCKCVCLCLSTISHVIIYKTVRHHRHAIQIQLQAVGSNTGNANNILGLKKSAFNAFVVFLVLIICYCPYLVVDVISSFYPINDFLARSLASTIVFTNSTLNPFLYCWRLSEIREVVLRTCRKLLCCK